MTTYNLHVVLLPRCITRCPLIGCHLTTRRCPFRNLLSRQTLRCNWLHLPRSHDGRSLKVCFGCSSVPSCHHQAELLSGTGWFWLSLPSFGCASTPPQLEMVLARAGQVCLPPSFSTDRAQLVVCRRSGSPPVQLCVGGSQPGQRQELKSGEKQVS